MKYFIEGLKKYAKFEGRARRKEYWMFILFDFIFTVAAAVLDEILGSEPVIYIVYNLVLILPTLAVLVRRLHDTNRSGWWILLPCISLIIAIFTTILFLFLLLPFDFQGLFLIALILGYIILIIGWVLLLVFTLQDSDVGENWYGKNPKTETA